MTSSKYTQNMHRKLCNFLRKYLPLERGKNTNKRNYFVGKTTKNLVPHIHTPKVDINMPGCKNSFKTINYNKSEKK